MSSTTTTTPAPRPMTDIPVHDGVELNAFTDPLRALPLESHQRRRCDTCSWPLYDPTDYNVWRIGRPDGKVVHVYLCAQCNANWERHEGPPAPARRMRRSKGEKERPTREVGI